jgi:hypothetical protein
MVLLIRLTAVNTAQTNEVSIINGGETRAMRLASDTPTRYTSPQPWQLLTTTHQNGW